MAQRLLIVAHGETPATKALMFGDPGELPRSGPAAERPNRILAERT